MSDTEPTSWEEEGRRLSPLLDHVFAVVIAGADAEAAASVAVGIARVQGARRRVAIADLVGETATLEALVSTDDPHGISDSFLYGVSLNKIARAVSGTENVFVMPSGTEAVALSAVYANDRWRRLAAGFQQVGALLIIVAVPGTGGFEQLCQYVGALMPVGREVFAMPRGLPIIAAPATRPVAPTPPPMPTVARPTAPSESAIRARAAASDDKAQRRVRLIATVSVAAAIAVGVGAFWSQIVAVLPAGVASMLGTTAPDTTHRLVQPQQMDSMSRDSLRRDTTGIDSSAALALAADSAAAARVTADSPPLVIANVSDSSKATRYAIFVSTANTRDAAMPDAKVKALSAVTMSPVLDGSDRWFRVTVGASQTKAEAETQLTALRISRIVKVGSILSVPFALRLDSGLDSAARATRMDVFSKRGLMVYALQQADGSANVYTGAFETPAQATMLADSLRSLGITPTLVYRTGRSF